MNPEILQHRFEYFCQKQSFFVSLHSWDICQISTMRKYWACLIPLLQVVLSDMFMHVTTKFLWHCWTQGIFVGDWNCNFGMSLLFANETATLHHVIMSFWISKHRLFGPSWDVIPQKLPPTVGFDSGYVNTASNLEILAQLVPFLISWPNEGVQQMMLGRVSKCVGMLGCFLLFFYALYLRYLFSEFSKTSKLAQPMRDHHLDMRSRHLLLTPTSLQGLVMCVSMLVSIVSLRFATSFWPNIGSSWSAVMGLLTTFNIGRGDLELPQASLHHIFLKKYVSFPCSAKKSLEDGRRRCSPFF